MFELLTDAGESGLDPKSAMNLANALKSAAAAQGISTKRRAQVEKDYAKAAEAAVDKVAKAEGFSPDTVRSIKADILGLEE